MILLDTNLLIYAWDKQAAQHSRAKSWVGEKLNGSARVGIPWQTSLGFLRIVTNARIYPQPASANDAWSIVTLWLECPNVWVPEAGARHREILATMVPHVGAGAKLFPDAHLAALSIEHGLTLCSTDGDFARFPNLRWRNPMLHRDI